MKEVLSEGKTRSGCRRHHEGLDDYPNVVKHIDDRHRIIRCSDDIQFISQHRVDGKSEYTWRSESFYTTVAGANRQSYPYREAALSLFEKLQ